MERLENPREPRSSDMANVGVEKDIVLKGQDATSSLEKSSSLSNGDEIHETNPFTEEEERRVRLKTDLVILPLLCSVFFLQYLDKQSLSYASVFGLITDLGLKGTQYSWCSSIFYIGMSLFQF
jgi:hypothetical protein